MPWMQPRTKSRSWCASALAPSGQAGTGPRRLPHSFGVRSRGPTVLWALWPLAPQLRPAGRHPSVDVAPSTRPAGRPQIAAGQWRHGGRGGEGFGTPFRLKPAARRHAQAPARPTLASWAWKRFSKLRTGAAQTRHDRSDRDGGDGGDLLVRELFQLAQHQRLAKARRESLERPAHCRAVASADRDSFGIIDFGVGDGVLDGVETERGERSPALVFAQIVDACIADDGQQPWLDGRAMPSAQAAVRPEQ